MKTYKQFLLLAISLVVISCKITTKKIDISIQANDTVSYEEPTIVNDELAMPDVRENALIESTNMVDSLEIEQITMRHDTLSILGWADYIVFPFGEFKAPEAIHKAYPYFEFKKIQYVPYEDDKSYFIGMFTYTYLNSKALFMDSRTDGIMDIRDAEIYDERILLKNNIHVGVGKEDFFKTLKLECDNMSDVNTVEFICVLDGYWQYYNFTDDTLQSILLRDMKNGRSDYGGIYKYQADINIRGGRWYDNDKQFIGDCKTILEISDDAAALNWGGGWAMPTLDDWTELQNNCILEWTDNYNSTNKSGYIVKSKAAGNTNSIFLPAVGCRRGSGLYFVGSRGYYWSASLSEEYSSNGRSGSFNSGGFSMGRHVRSEGLPVRPVCPAQGNTNGHVAVDLGLPSGKLWATCNVGASVPEKNGSYFAWGETETKSNYSWNTYKHMFEGGTNWQDINKYTIK